MVKRGKKGGLYDSFRNRVMFPIIDIRGNVIAFGGRVLDDSKPKYLNTNDTVVYKKSRSLFAFGFAKAAGKRKLILTEGYMDTIAVHAAGFENAVATCGTALTAEQARMMAGIADEIIIAYDSDGPGQTATRRAMNILSQAGLTSRVLKMEGAKDPDEYIKKFGAARFGVLLEQSENVMDYQLEELLRQYDITTSNGKIEYLRRSAALLAEVERQDEREIYLNRIAKQLDLGVDTVRSSVEAARNNRQPPPTAAAVPKGGRFPGGEPGPGESREGPVSQTGPGGGGDYRLSDGISGGDSQNRGKAAPGIFRVRLQPAGVPAPAGRVSSRGDHRPGAVSPDL